MQKVIEMNILNSIRGMSYVEANSNDLAMASIVRIKEDRECFRCGKIIKAGSQCVTASHMEDKLKGVKLKELLKTHSDVREYKFVPIRHWVCNCCVDNILKSKIKQSKAELSDIDMSERHEIQYISLIEAVGIGQE